MAHSKTVRDAVRAAYIHESLPLPRIAELHGVSQPVIRQWKARAKKQGDDWDRARLASEVGARGVAEASEAMLVRYLRQAQVLMPKIEDDPEIGTADKIKLMAMLSDSYSKMTASFARANPKVNELTLAMDVVRLLADHVMAHHRDHAAELVAVLESFGPVLTAKYG